MTHNNKHIVDLFMDENFLELSKIVNVYCPFEAMRVEGHEIRHSNFLGDILDPSKTHGFGDYVLSFFLCNLFREANKNELALKVITTDLSNAEIKREFPLGKNRLDLVIQIPNFSEGKNFVLIIEIKVEARQREIQLENYRKAAEEKWGKDKNDLFYFYLTLNNERPNDEDWVPVGFELVVKSIEAALKLGSGGAFSRTMAQAYVDMVRWKISPDYSDKERENIDRLTRDYKNILAEININDANTPRYIMRHKNVLSVLLEGISTQPTNSPISCIIEMFKSDEFKKNLEEKIAGYNHLEGFKLKNIGGNNTYTGFSVEIWGRDDFNNRKNDPILNIIGLSIEHRLRFISASVGMGPDPSILSERQSLYNFFRDKHDVLKRTGISQPITDSHTTFRNERIWDKDQIEDFIGQTGSKDEKLKELKEKAIADLSVSFGIILKALKEYYQEKDLSK